MPRFMRGIHAAAKQPKKSERFTFPAGSAKRRVRISGFPVIRRACIDVRRQTNASRRKRLASL
jgi:hypothetical protein